jgi:hypothetical protein
VGPTPEADLGPEGTDPDLIRITSSPDSSDKTFVTAPYRGYWFSIDDQDLRSKRLFTFLMTSSRSWRRRALELPHIDDPGEPVRRPVGRFSMMRRSTVLVVIGMTVLFSMRSGLAAPPALAETLLPLKIGYQSSSSDDWLLFAARDLKLFKRVGLALEYTRFNAGPPMVEAAKNRY